MKSWTAICLDSRANLLSENCLYWVDIFMVCQFSFDNSKLQSFLSYITTNISHHINTFIVEFSGFPISPDPTKYVDDLRIRNALDEWQHLTSNGMLDISSAESENINVETGSSFMKPTYHYWSNQEVEYWDIPWSARPHCPPFADILKTIR